MKSVDFFCIGAQKAGTTLLHDILIQHPEIYLPPDKEAHFFDVNERYEKGLDFYKSFFPSFSNEKIVGNINPNLQIDNRSIDRIIDCYGNEKIKIIFLLRDPVKRMYSHYLMSKKRGYEDLSFEEALKQEKSRISNPKKYKQYYTNEPGHFEKDHLGYSLRSHYFKTINYLFENFPAKNVKIIFFEEFIKNKETTIKEVLEFLDLKDNFKFNLSIKSNPAQKPKSVLLSKFLFKSSLIKRTIKKIIPSSVRHPIKEFTIQKNLKTLSENEKKLSEVTYNNLRNDFVEEIRLLENILERKIDLW